MPVAQISSGFPLRLGQTEEFARVRAFFQDAGFEEVNICKKLGLEDMSDLGRVDWETSHIEDFPAGLRWSMQVFMRGMPTPQKELKAAFGEQVFQDFLSLRLLRPAKTNPDLVVCPIWLYPADGFLIASDRRDDPDGQPYSPPEDVVFPAIYAGTLRFLRLLPQARGGDALDLCGGSGIGALHLSRVASTAATADLTARSAAFAEFNARLNAAPITSLCGDLYDPVSNLQYDIISAHPPFVPATGPNMVYRDGGETGEEVVRRIVEGLPGHLKAGGVAIILCVARDIQDKPFERRVSDWLGASRQNFDVIFGLEKVLSVQEVVESLRKRGQAINNQQAQALHDRLQSLQTRQFVYGALFVRHCSSIVAQDPIRVRLTPSGTARDFERLFAWRNQCRRPNFVDWLSNSRPHLPPGLELTVRHVVAGGQLTPAEFVFSIADGFQAAMRPDAWLTPLIAQLDGRRSVRQVFDAMSAAGELPAGFKLDDFGNLISTMIERGLLLVDLAEPPQPTVNPGKSSSRQLTTDEHR
jgi:methylase of polypeptide subunit release factors